MRISLRLAAFHITLAACANAAAGEATQACDAPGFEQVLQAGPAAIEARRVA